MSGSNLLFCVLVSSLAGCSSVGNAKPNVAPSATSKTGDKKATPFAGITEAGAALPQKTEPATAGASYWKGPEFEKRMMESYLSETAIEPKTTPTEREVLAEVFPLITDEKLDEAQKLLESNSDSTSSAVFDFTLANIHFQKDELDLAMAGYEAAVHKHPKFLRAWEMLGQLYFRENQLEKAVGAFTMVLDLGQGDALSYGLLGLAHSRREDYVAAESAFRLATMLAPDKMDWKIGLADSLLRQRRYAAGAAFLASLIDEQPDRAELWMEHGKAYIGLEKPLQAAESFEMVDSLGQSTHVSLNYLGGIYANEGLFDLAVDSYLRALKKKPEAGPADALRGAKYLSANSATRETGQLLAGIESILGERLAAADRKELLRLRARVALAEGAGADEAQTLEEIVDLDPLDGDALIKLGQYYFRGGDSEKAIFYYERAANIEGFEADAKLRHGEVLVKEGKYAQALPMLRRSQELKPRASLESFLEQVERFATTRS